MLKASPRSRSGKYDFIKSLLRGMNQPHEEHDAPKWDLIGELLHAGREEAATEENAGATLGRTGEPESKGRRVMLLMGTLEGSIPVVGVICILKYACTLRTGLQCMQRLHAFSKEVKMSRQVICSPWL